MFQQQNFLFVDFNKTKHTNLARQIHNSYEIDRYIYQSIENTTKSHFHCQIQASLCVTKPSVS